MTFPYEVYFILCSCGLFIHSVAATAIELARRMGRTNRLVLTLILWFAIAVMHGHVFGAATKIQPSVTEANSRAEQTMQGLFHYYWRQDSQVKQIEFFFACGQIGGADGGQACTCENTASCTACYRWWDAIAMESVATYGIYTNSTSYSKIADTIFAHSPYNSNWPGDSRCTFIDDFAWYGIAYLRVYEWLKV